MNRSLARVALGLGALFLTTACAFGTTPVDVTRSPFGGGSPPREGDIAVRTLEDLRPVDRRPYVGAKRNGYGMVLGHLSVPPGRTLTEILSGHLVEGLQHAGYRAALEGAGSDDVPEDFDPVAFLEGDVHDFWLDMYMATWHNADLGIRLRDGNDELLWEGRYKGDESNVLWLGLTPEFERVIRQALDKALHSAVADFSHEDFAAQIRFAAEQRRVLDEATHIAGEGSDPLGAGEASVPTPSGAPFATQP